MPPAGEVHGSALLLPLKGCGWGCWQGLPVGDAFVFCARRREGVDVRLAAVQAMPALAHVHAALVHRAVVSVRVDDGPEEAADRSHYADRLTRPVFISSGVSCRSELPRYSGFEYARARMIAQGSGVAGAGGASAFAATIATFECSFGRSRRPPSPASQ